MEIELIVGGVALLLAVAGGAYTLFMRGPKADWAAIADGEGEPAPSGEPAAPAAPVAADTAPSATAPVATGQSDEARRRWFIDGLSRSREAFSASLSRALGRETIDAAALAQQRRPNRGEEHNWRSQVGFSDGEYFEPIAARRTSRTVGSAAY